MVLSIQEISGSSEIFQVSLSEKQADRQEITIDVPLIIRGEIISPADVSHVQEYRSRGGRVTFRTPRVEKFLNKIVLQDPNSMIEDLYDLDTKEVIEFLAKVGKMITLRNDLVVQTASISQHISDLPPGILQPTYDTLPNMFDPDLMWFEVESEIGSKFLDNWVEFVDTEKRPVPLPTPPNGLQFRRGKIRAFGSRILTILAGNVPLVSALSLMRGCLIRADNIYKLPSNDLLTMPLLLRLAMDVDPDHPLLKHQVAVYWKGGDSSVENFIFSSDYIDKAIAWGGHGSISSFLSKAPVGVDILTFDPKLSVSMIGKEAFICPQTLHQAVELALTDTLAFNQQACVASRIHFIEGTRVDAERYASMCYEMLLQMEKLIPNPHFPADLRETLETLSLFDEEYTVFGAKGNEGAVIVSNGPAADIFPECRTINVVPVQDLRKACAYVDKHTSTVGVFPEYRKLNLRDTVIAQGGQRLVSLGSAGTGVLGLPHDGHFPLSRMIRWGLDEEHIMH